VISVVSAGRWGLCCAALVAGLWGRSVAAQSSCTRNGTSGSCTIGNNATYSIRLTITRAVRLELSGTGGVALNAPTADDFVAGVGQTTGPIVTVKSNSAWTVSLRSTNLLWTGVGPWARTDKPVGELRWATAPAGSYVPMTTAPATVLSGAATAGTNVTLYFRVTYAFLSDPPGTYSLPLVLLITSP
jgi:hypothetical protein